MPELGKFLDSIASANPIPGGGSSAALCGAMAAGLVGMVCRVTMKSQRGVDTDELGRVAHRADELRHELLTLIELDGESYRQVLQAYKLPKENSARQQTIQDALVDATAIPMRTAKFCGEALALAAFIAPKAKRNALSDLSVGALIAQAGLRGAAITAETNLREIRDDSFVHAERARIAPMLDNAEVYVQQILREIQTR